MSTSSIFRLNQTPFRTGPVSPSRPHAPRIRSQVVVFTYSPVPSDTWGRRWRRKPIPLTRLPPSRAVPLTIAQGPCDRCVPGGPCRNVTTEKTAPLIPSTADQISVMDRWLKTRMMVIYAMLSCVTIIYRSSCFFGLGGVIE